jgi:RNase P subunit RPR2
MARQICEKCDEYILLFEMIGAGIRVKRERDKKMFYSVRCPKCGDYEMEAPR